jgi:thioredoxin-like negative regulator of GroEL
MADRGWESTGLEVLRANDFEATHLKRGGIYAVCFGATWCRPTRSFVHKFVARNGRLSAKLGIADITDWNDPLWDSFDIKITPTMVVFRDGTPLDRFDGRRFIGLRDSDLDRLTDLLGKLGGSVTAAAVSPP